MAEPGTTITDLTTVDGGTVPIIDKLPEAGRPLWSVMIPTFNSTRFLEATLQSVLAQDPGSDRMQIEVIDNCSTEDDPEPVVMKLGGGRILFHRNAYNQGAITNFNNCIMRSRGRLVHILHADDFVQMGFYREFEAAFEEEPNCAAVFCRVFIVDENSELLTLSAFCRSLAAPTNDASELMISNPLRAPAAVVRRCFFERHGGFDPALIHTADWDMWTRAVTNGRARMLNRPLASYRMYSSNDTSRLVRSGEHLRDLLRLADKRDAQGLKGFDRAAFERSVLAQGCSDARRFKKAGDHEAARANYAFFQENSGLLRRGHIFLGCLLRELASG